MATHPNIVPSFPIQKQTTPKVRTVVFGDGFQQRLTYGLNQNPEIYNFAFENITEEESDVLEAFLRTVSDTQESFNFTPPQEGKTGTGTYSRTGNTVTITIANHGIAVGDKITIDFTSGSAADGDYIVATSVDQNTFTVITTASGTTNGNVSITLSGQKKFICKEWKKDINYANIATIRTRYEEVFET